MASADTTRSTLGVIATLGLSLLVSSVSATTIEVTGGAQRLFLDVGNTISAAPDALLSPEPVSGPGGGYRATHRLASVGILRSDAIALPLDLTVQSYAGDPAVFLAPSVVVGLFGSDRAILEPVDTLDGELETLSEAGRPGIVTTNSSLTMARGTEPQPLPTAVWLLGSALVGLVGVARIQNRRETSASA